MAINFPDNPTDGFEYPASNGIVYTYNAANDSWTGALSTGGDYWDQDASGNLYPKDTNADVFVGGNSSAANIVLDASGAITAAGSIDCSDAIASDRSDSTSNAFVAKLSGNVKATISNGGSITTAGTLNANNYDIDALAFLP